MRRMTMIAMMAALALGALGCMAKLGYTTHNPEGGLRRADLLVALAQRIDASEGAMDTRWEADGSGALATGQAVHGADVTTQTAAVEAIVTGVVRGITAAGGL